MPLRPLASAEGAIDNMRGSGRFPERHDQSRAMKLEKSSNGYCPVCGHWSIITNLEDAQTRQKYDFCFVCETLFDSSGLSFTDSQVCSCGHPKEYHDRNALACTKGRASVNCHCDKYKPTQVHVSP